MPTALGKSLCHLVRIDVNFSLKPISKDGFPSFPFLCHKLSFFHKVETLQKAYGRLDGKSAVELLLLLKSLGMHSINPLGVIHKPRGQVWGRG